MSKSPSAFRTISEVAEELDVPAHVLRFWESKFAQVKPMKRGGGRRYYRPSDVDLLRGIRELLYTDGLTIKGVQKVLREQGVKSVLARGGAAAEVVVEERQAAAGGGGTVVSGGSSRPSLSVAASSEEDEPDIDEDAARRARIESTIRRLTSLRDRLRDSA